jgi:hypothetical protein
MITFGQKAKFASLVARQAAISARICTGSTWELAVNLVLDRPEPQEGITLRQISMNIPSKAFPSKPLFHTVDRLWWSQNGITFTFLPENEEEARSFIARLIPFLTATESPWFLKLFTKEAKLWHAQSRWDPQTQQVFSAEEAELKDLLTDDDEMNKSDEPTLPCRLDQVDVYISRVANLEKDPSLYREDNSVSTFHPQSTATLPSISFNPKVIPNHRAPTPYCWGNNNYWS